MQALLLAGPLEAITRWTARLLAVLLVGVVIVIFVGQGFNPLRLTRTEAVQMVFFGTTCAGMLIGWRWEVLGGALATMGIALFFATEYSLTGRFPHGFMFHLMLLPGVLFLVSGALRKCVPSRR
jgi:hypothetical protein